MEYRAVGVAEARGLSGPVSLQPQYNLLARAMEWEIVPACQDAGLGLLAWSPLAHWELNRNHPRGKQHAAGTRVAENADEGMRIWNQHGQDEHTWQVVDAVRTVAGGRGVAMAQVAAGPARGLVGDPRRPHDRAAHREPGRRRSPAQCREGAGAGRGPASQPPPTTLTARRASPGASAASRAAGSEDAGRGRTWSQLGNVTVIESSVLHVLCRMMRAFTMCSPESLARRSQEGIQA
jgi:hypothetical protein